MNRADVIYHEHYSQIRLRTDKMFSYLFLFQWILGIVLAVTLTPRTWSGSVSDFHFHLYEAIFLGAIIPSLPLFLILKKPEAVETPYLVAVSQILTSSLLIHLSGGRIETHFHIFGSLAFLAFYRNWKVLALATAVTAFDHLAAGMFWPLAVYGTLSAGSWRAIEHSAWVLFEDFCLVYSTEQGLKEMRMIAERQSSLEDTIADVEQQVRDRTLTLVESQKMVTAQQQALMTSSKLSALGEMAGGVAHEINNPLAVISQLSSQIEELIAEETIDRGMVTSMIHKVEGTTQRIAQIVKGLRNFSRDANLDPFEQIDAKHLLEETLSFCQERIRSRGINLITEFSTEDLIFEARGTEISQVLLNLLNNACDAVEPLAAKWIRVQIESTADFILVKITDSGSGLSKEIEAKIFNPFFTTKPLGKGTGLGLSISSGIVTAHGGSITLERESSHTQFLVSLPRKQNANPSKLKAA